MSNIYQSLIHGKFTEIKAMLCAITDKVYICPEKDEATMVQANLAKAKENAIKTINVFCPAIEHKMELLNYKLQSIRTFNWEMINNFDRYKNEANDGTVEQNLQDRKLRIKFSHKDTMYIFIYTEISTFFSIINSIIDNIAEILYHTFNLNFDRMITIKNVIEELEDENLKKFLQQRFFDDPAFRCMRDIRKVFEHKNHLDPVNIQNTTTSNLSGQIVEEVTIARLKVELIKDGLPPELSTGRIDVCCDFLYKEITEALQDFIIEVSKA